MPLPRETEEMRHNWRGRLLAGAHGRLGAVAMSVVAHDLKDAIAMKTLLQTVFPGYEGISMPFLVTCGKISRQGRVYAQVMVDFGITRTLVLFESEHDLESDFRKLADELRFSDDDRVAMFAALKNWIVADFRLDPNSGELETRH